MTKSSEFFQFIRVPREANSCRIFDIATKIVTLQEIQECKNGFLDSSTYRDELKNIKRKLKKLAFPEFLEEVRKVTSRPYKKVLRKAFASRGITRWQKRVMIVKCDDMSHMLDVAIFAYLLALKEEKGEAYATKAFWIGLFHDWPECYTGDWPSPLKDAILGLRRATEHLENIEMENGVYSKVDPWMATAIKEMMLEESSNASMKELIKKADYFSADYECSAQFSNLGYYADILKKDAKKNNLPEEFQILVKEWSEFAEKSIPGDPLDRVLHVLELEGNQDKVIEVLKKLLPKMLPEILSGLQEELNKKEREEGDVIDLLEKVNQRKKPY